MRNVGEDSKCTDVFPIYICSSTERPAAANERSIAVPAQNVACATIDWWSQSPSCAMACSSVLPDCWQRRGEPAVPAAANEHDSAVLEQKLSRGFHQVPQVHPADWNQYAGPHQPGHLHQGCSACDGEPIASMRFGSKRCVWLVNLSIMLALSHFEPDRAEKQLLPAHLSASALPHRSADVRTAS